MKIEKAVFNPNNYSSTKKVNLSPLSALCSDYQDTVSLLRARENDLKDIQNSSTYKFSKKISKIKKKLF